MNQRVIINVIALGAALVLALFLGQWVVTAPKEVGIGFACVFAIITFLVMKQNVWILIPAFMTLGITFPWIPGNFAPVELACMYVIACFFILLISNKLTFKLSLTSLEWWAVCVFLMIAQAFVRNPAGLHMLGTEYVGGRPYFVVAISFTAGLALATIRTNHTQIRKAFYYSMLSYLGSFLIQAVAFAFGSVAYYTGRVFGAYGSESSEILGGSHSGRAGRNEPARILGLMGSRFLTANRDPLKSVLHPVWGIVLVVSILAAGLSGFRSIIAVVGLTIIVGIYYWGGVRSLILALMMVITGYVAVNIVNMAYPLPAKIQRSLSFIPGTWDKQHIYDADASTDWRVKMWEDALFTDIYIENKILGDGLGIRRDDFAYMLEISRSRMVTDEMSQERAALAGDFHSGPVTTIRVIGYVGLIIMVLAMCVLAYRAHRLILASRNKPYFREVMFFCLPMVCWPILFLLVFGNFKEDAPLFFLQIGILRMLEKNLANRS